MEYLFPVVFLVLVPAGFGITLLGIAGLVRTKRAYARALRIQGTIVRLELASSLSGSFDSNATSNPARHPVVRFVAPSGEAREFRSEYGSSDRDFLRMEPGQSIEVLYDPEGAMKPTIHRWGAVWGLSLTYLLMGPVALAFAMVLWFLGAGAFFQKSLRPML